MQKTTRVGQDIEIPTRIYRTKAHRPLDHEVIIILIIVANPGLKQVTENVQRFCLAGIVFEKFFELIADVRTFGLEMQIRNE